MKKLIIIAAIVLLAGCATTPCPSKDKIVFTEDGFSVWIDKGFFDNAPYVHEYWQEMEPEPEKEGI